MKELVRLIATGLYSGYFPIVAGTIGTIPAWLLAWFYAGNGWFLPVAAVVSTALSFWSSDRAEKFLGHDSKKIVIDEWAGMFIALLFLPHQIEVYLGAFLFFRFFDVIKPFPADRCEALHGGLGVTLDDVVAGIYANLACWLSIYALSWLGWFGF